MRLFTRILGLVGLLLTLAPSVHAKSAIDPSGHWEGSVQIPGREVIFEVDLARSAKGELSGTMNPPAEKITGLPLRAVVVDGKSISFNARRDQPFTRHARRRRQVDLWRVRLERLRPSLQPDPDR